MTDEKNPHPPGTFAHAGWNLGRLNDALKATTVAEVTKGWARMVAAMPKAKDFRWRR